MARVLGRWEREGDWSLADAVRAVRMIGTGNAERIYGLQSPAHRQSPRSMLKSRMPFAGIVIAAE